MTPFAHRPETRVEALVLVRGRIKGLAQLLAWPKWTPQERKTLRSRLREARRVERLLSPRRRRGLASSSMTIQPPVRWS